LSTPDEERRQSGSLDAPLSEAHGRWRKIDPTLTEGELVRVAGGRNQAEAELIQNLLIEEGIPSTLRRSAGFDVPDFLAAGPRDVLVPRGGEEAARELLGRRPSGAFVRGVAPVWVRALALALAVVIVVLVVTGVVVAVVG
jgi:hypothetical protein